MRGAERDRRPIKVEGTPYSGIRFIYFEDEQMTKRKDYTVKQLELDFWDKLARVTAYAALQTISEVA
jgi:hypothetical protein